MYIGGVVAPELIISAGSSAPGKEQAGGASFASALEQVLDKVNTSQVVADEALKGFLVGDIQDIHMVALASEEARLMMQLAVEIRNKVVEAYQEMSRMQV